MSGDSSRPRAAKSSSSPKVARIHASLTPFGLVCPPPPSAFLCWRTTNSKQLTSCQLCRAPLRGTTNGGHTCRLSSAEASGQNLQLEYLQGLELLTGTSCFLRLLLALNISHSLVNRFGEARVVGPGWIWHQRHWRVMWTTASSRRTPGQDINKISYNLFVGAGRGGHHGDRAGRSVGSGAHPVRELCGELHSRRRQQPIQRGRRGGGPRSRSWWTASRWPNCSLRA